MSGGRVPAHIPGTMGVEAKARIEEGLWAEGVKLKEEVEGVTEEAVEKPGLELEGGVRWEDGRSLYQLQHVAIIFI